MAFVDKFPQMTVALKTGGKIRHKSGARGGGGFYPTGQSRGQFGVTHNDVKPGAVCIIVHNIYFNGSVLFYVVFGTETGTQRE